MHLIDYMCVTCIKVDKDPIYDSSESKNTKVIIVPETKQSLNRKLKWSIQLNKNVEQKPNLI